MTLKLVDLQIALNEITARRNIKENLGKQWYVIRFAQVLKNQIKRKHWEHDSENDNDYKTNIGNSISSIL